MFSGSKLHQSIRPGVVKACGMLSGCTEGKTEDQRASAYVCK